MDDFISIEGPVELVGGELMIRIPLSAGGDELAPLARGIGQIEGDCLCVIIRPWLAEKLRIGEGSLIVVDNKNGSLQLHVAPLTVRRSSKRQQPNPPLEPAPRIRGE